MFAYAKVSWGKARESTIGAIAKPSILGRVKLSVTSCVDARVT